MKWTEDSMRRYVNDINSDLDTTTVPEDYNCFYCDPQVRDDCPYAFDAYNIGDGCLANK